MERQEGKKNSSRLEAKWRESRAKSLLVEGLTVGTIPLTSKEMMPKVVYTMHEEFKSFKYTNFRTNLNNLRKDFIERKQRSVFDENALKNDRQIVQRGTQTQRGYPFWPQADASKLLASDLKEGRRAASSIEATSLYTTWPEYQVFPIAVFRDHVHQELRSQRERPYWLHKKEQKRKQARGENILEDIGDDEPAGDALF